jgi:hypothetical protein
MLLSPGDSDAAQAAGPRWSGRGRQGSRDRRAHELSVLRRQNKWPRFRRSDRTFLAAAARRLPRIAIETVWLKRFYVLVFIGARDKARPSRRLHHQPDGAWVTQQARTSPSSSTNEHSRSGFSSMTATPSSAVLSIRCLRPRACGWFAPPSCPTRSIPGASGSEASCTTGCMRR